MADFDFSAVGIASGRRRLAGFISGPTRRPTPSTLPARRPMPSIPGRRRSGPRLVLGAHQSIAGGFHRAVERAIETGCECLQIFTRNINQWAVSPIAADDASKFQEAVRSAGLALVVAHDSYLINPASADPDLRKKSIAGLIEEVRRAEMLGIPWVVAHPGAAGEQPVTAAVARAAAGIAEALRKVQVPFGVNSIAQAAAIASLHAEEELLERVQAIRVERTRVEAGLLAAGLKPSDSEANFVWMRLGERTMGFAAGCDAIGLSVRPFAGEGVRITIGEPEANSRLIEFAESWRE